jgi:hypothetical protein
MRTTTGYLVTVDGEGREVELVPGERALDLMYRAIGCSTVDLVRVGGEHDIDVWLDDEGMFNSRPNVIGTAVVAALVAPSGRQMTQHLYGHLLFLGSENDGEDAAGLDSIELALIRGFTETCRELAAK